MIVAVPWTGYGVTTLELSPRNAANPERMGASLCHFPGLRHLTCSGLCVLALVFVCENQAFLKPDFSQSSKRKVHSVTPSMLRNEGWRITA